MKKLILIILICALALMTVTLGAAALRIWDNGQKLTLTLSGERQVYMEYGEDYVDAGVKAQLIFKDSTTDIPIETQGQVDTRRLGKYLLKYTARHENLVRTEYRYVHVKDTQAPVITLKEDPDAFTLIGEVYKEEGFTATDNYDGDLTGQVVRKEADGTVIYTVTDSSGNTASVTRTIAYIDPGLPRIQLVGGQYSFITAGENYADPGYTATDKDDGDLTSSVVVTGVVDNLNAGVYTLQYTVTNRQGMTAKTERTIYVIPRQEEDKGNPEKPEEIPDMQLPTGGTTIEPNGKTIYLTFDDGPSSHTARLLDVLAKYDVKVTFFVMNTSHIDMIARAAQEGHAIAIHTYTHRYSEIYASDKAFLDDMQKMQDVIYQYTGIRTMLTRFPGGSSNSVSSAYNRGIMTRLTKKLREMGYQYFDWNVDSNDAGGAKTAEEVFKNVTKGIGNKTQSVVLQHDTQDFSVDAVERIIAWGLCNGYTFRALDVDSPGCHHGVNN